MGGPSHILSKLVISKANIPTLSQEAQTGEVKLNDHEPEKIEWLLRFIYHQDLEWHRSEGNTPDGFLPMLIELIILGDYFLVNGLVDMAQDAILETCSGFAVDIWSLPGEPTIGTSKYEIVPSIDKMTTEIIKATTLTSAASGPTQPFRKFLVKFIIDVFGCTSGISAWSPAGTFVFRKQSRLASKLRDLVTSIPGLEDELKAALFDSAFPNLSGKDSHPRQWANYYTLDDTCSSNCIRHLGGDKGNGGLMFNPAAGSGKRSCCLHCSKVLLKIAWRDFMMRDGR